MKKIGILTRYSPPPSIATPAKTSRIIRKITLTSFSLRSLPAKAHHFTMNESDAVLKNRDEHHLNSGRRVYYTGGK